MLLKRKNIEREIDCLEQIHNEPKPYLVRVHNVEKKIRYYEVEMDYYQDNLKQFLIKNWNVC